MKNAFIYTGQQRYAINHVISHIYLVAPIIKQQQSLGRHHYAFYQIVFNVVASVKFNEKLRDAVDINVLGTKKVLDLVMGMKHLKVSIVLYI